MSPLLIALFFSLTHICYAFPDATRTDALRWVRQEVQSSSGWVRVSEASQEGYVYDNCLAVLSFLQAAESGDTVALGDARKILAFLEDHAVTDGLASYWLDKVGADGASLPQVAVSSGNQAWALYTLARFMRATGETHYLALARSAARWLMDERRLDAADGGIRGGLNSNGTDRPWTATEHNVIAYFAFKELFAVDPVAAYHEVSEGCADWLITRGWNPEKRYFNRGEGDSVLSLDAQTGGILFLLDRGLDLEAWSAGAVVVKRLLNRIWIREGRRQESYLGTEFEDGDGSLWWEGAAQASLSFDRLSVRLRERWDSNPVPSEKSTLRASELFKKMVEDLRGNLLKSDDPSTVGRDNDGDGGYQYALEQGSNVGLGTGEQPSPGLWLIFSIGEHEGDVTPLYGEMP
ncbi:MAG: hypothetical protein HYY14_02080 [Candidatus Omnitrophica bacterium]|nr:hypothetical protein [Candidatus Omnitrophota bacterium]